MEYDIIEGDWTDAGTFESLQSANPILLEYNNEIDEVIGDGQLCS